VDAIRKAIRLESRFYGCWKRAACCSSCSRHSATLN